MTSRPVVAVVFGGRSSEHEISCLSAGSVLAAIDRSRYEVVAVGITRDGRWVRADDDPDRYRLIDGQLPQVDPHWRTLAWEFAPAGLRDGETTIAIDLVFPILHGAYGEDGTVQGLLEMAGLPYVGSGVIASAMAMDKIVMKQAFERAGLPTAQWEVVAGDAESTLPYPRFVKPSRAGSSQGISKVHDPSEWSQAVAEARTHDPRVIAEAGVSGREIECGVLELIDGSIATSQPAEIVVLGDHEFYDFQAKYLDGSTRLDVPAILNPEVAARVRELAAAAFRALQCEGLARVDFFVTEAGEVLVNEINTMPGFTPTSMYPLMWKAEGLEYPALVEALISRALARPRTVLR